MKEKILGIFECISWGLLATLGITVVLFCGISISQYIATIIHINENTIGLLSISFSVLLIFITACYASLTYKILIEQTNSRQILAMEKKLEKVYCPLNEAANTLLLDNLNFNIMDVDTTYRHFNNKLEYVRKNYGYIVFTDTKLQNCSQEIFNSWNDFVASQDESKLSDFKSSIKRFLDYTDKAISKYDLKIKKILGEK